MATVKEANLLQVGVLNAPDTASVNVVTRKLVFTGLIPISLEDIVSYKSTVYAAGTLELQTLDTALIAVANSTLYTLTIRNKATSAAKTYSVFTPATGTTATSIKNQFVTVVNNDAEAIVTAASTGATTFTLTEKTLDSKGFISTAPTGVTVVVTTPHVDASGTTAVVTVYDPVNVLTAAQYRTLEFIHKRVLQGNIMTEVKTIVFADQLATSGGNYANFVTALNNMTSAANLADAAAQKFVEIV